MKVPILRQAVPARRRNRNRDAVIKSIVVGLFVTSAFLVGFLHECMYAKGAPQNSEVERVDAAVVRSGILYKVTPERRRQLVTYMVEAGRKYQMDPLFIGAVAWIESRWTNPRVNATKDRGVLQVHWQPREPWLQGIKRADLLKPRVNIMVGVAELSHVRSWCKRKRHTLRQHHWVAHYKYGPNVTGRRYDKAVMYIYRKLLRAAKRNTNIDI